MIQRIDPPIAIRIHKCDGAALVMLHWRYLSSPHLDIRSNLRSYLEDRRDDILCRRGGVADIRSDHDRVTRSPAL
jgi:hypothetical protein